MTKFILNLRIPIFELIYFCVCLILSIYFLLATFKGEYGLFKKYQLLATENALKIDLMEQTKIKQIIQNKVNRLSISSSLISPNSSFSVYDIFMIL